MRVGDSSVISRSESRATAKRIGEGKDEGGTRQYVRRAPFWSKMSRRKEAAAPAIVLMVALPAGPASFKARAQVSVDRTVITLASAVATVEPNHMASGYRWLRVYLYAFPFTAADAAAAARGDFHTLDLGWPRTPGVAHCHSVSNAGFQLSVDTDGKVWQMDLAVPGHVHDRRVRSTGGGAAAGAAPRRHGSG